MNVSKKIAIVALVLIGLWSCATKIYQGQRGPSCLGPVCLDADVWKDAEPFFQKYGVGFERDGKFPAYWYQDGSNYIYIGRYHGENRPINDIVVSKYPYYSTHAFPPKQSFGVLATEKGIELGVTYDQVVRTYGMPDQLYTDVETVKGKLSESWESVDSGKIRIARYETLYAEDDYGPWALFFFENDVLIAMELSNSL
ncbi:MAG: hypothetical protein JEY79_19340 [Pseudodesulfovibrio sp.]|nr:hypothetical protein [Pseudodesulfovibrio sp.]